MKKVLLFFASIIIASPSFANEFDLDTALVGVINNCSGISAEFNKMKNLAGINTAVTSVGTLVGGGAIATGFMKQRKDKLAEELEKQWLEIDRLSKADVVVFMEKIGEYNRLKSELDKTTQQSKNLGNWRTGLLVGNTATNIAGAIIAGNNKASTDLKGAIDDCKKSLKDLPGAKMQERLNGGDEIKIAATEQIIEACGAWEYTDVSKIDNRATGAMWSSVAGAGMGTAGTITSAIANTDKTRNDNTDGGKSKEKNLNTASNVLAIGATAGSLAATVFNAAQISAIKKASMVADNCERALQ